MAGPLLPGRPAQAVVVVPPAVVPLPLAVRASLPAACDSRHAAATAPAVGVAGGGEAGEAGEATAEAHSLRPLLALLALLLLALLLLGLRPAGVVVRRQPGTRQWQVEVWPAGFL